MGFKHEAEQIGAGVEDIGAGVRKAFSPAYWRQAAADAKAAAGNVAANAGKAAAQEGIVSKFFGGIGKLILAPIKWGMNAATGVVDFAAGIVMKPLKVVTQSVGKIFNKNPRTAVLGTAILGTVAVANVIGRRHSKQAEMERDAYGEMLQAQAAAQGGRPVSYMNSASQADVDARIAADRAAGVASSSQAEALAARQAAASQASPAV